MYWEGQRPSVITQAGKENEATMGNLLFRLCTFITNIIIHLKMNIQHSTFNIQHSTFNIQHSTFNIRHSGLFFSGWEQPPPLPPPTPRCIAQLDTHCPDSPAYNTLQQHLWTPTAPFSPLVCFGGRVGHPLPRGARARPAINKSHDCTYFSSKKGRTQLEIYGCSAS